jgi:Domain of unknown function (DUF3331)
MNQNHRTCFVWQSTLTLLGENAGLGICASSNPAARERREHGEHTTASRIVTASCRLSEVTISVSWHDPTSCRYDDQTWRLGIARYDGRCALTGLPIYEGGKVYRPIPLRPAPSNSNAMILAVAVEHLPADGEIVEEVLDGTAHSSLI